MQSVQDWHARYVQQAQWTSPLRQYLYQKAGIPGAGSLLEVGCGTGALLMELSAQGQADLHGLDINPENLDLCARNAPQARLTCGDAHRLPYRQASFQAVICHYLCLWLADPARGVQEMARVVRPGGWVLALAEPDYGGRIDSPIELAEMGRLQMDALRRQGADPRMGRRLAGLLSGGGLTRVEAGVIGGEWKFPAPAESWQAEWKVFEADLEGTLGADRLASLRGIDARAWRSGERILYVPTFYAWGRKE